nr:LURP1-like domain-containing protein [Tanacetum cinerariifolium]
MAISPIPIEDQDKTVEEYWNTTGNGNRKWDELSTFLSPDSFKVIASYYVSSSCEDEDSVYWGGSSIGKFSVKSAFSLIRNEDDPQRDKKWDVIWKATVSERIKMFLWLAVHDRLRVTRKLTNDPRCTRCGADEESLDHILRRCPSSFMIWNKLGTHPPRSSFWTLPVCKWIVDNLSTSHANNDSKDQIMFAITLWWLRKWRNKKIFGRDEEIPIDPIRFLHTKLKEMSDALFKDDMRKQGCYKIRKEVFIGWVTPPDGWVMLNTDGA